MTLRDRDFGVGSNSKRMRSNEVLTVPCSSYSEDSEGRQVETGRNASNLLSHQRVFLRCPVSNFRTQPGRFIHKFECSPLWRRVISSVRVGEGRGRGSPLHGQGSIRLHSYIDGHSREQACMMMCQVIQMSPLRKPIVDLGYKIKRVRPRVRYQEDSAASSREMKQEDYPESNGDVRIKVPQSNSQSHGIGRRRR